MVKLPPGAQARLEAANRLNPEAKAVRDRCIEKENNTDKVGLRSAWELGHLLKDVKTNSDRYGVMALSDLVASLSYKQRTVEKYMHLTTVIPEEDLVNLEQLRNGEGRALSVTHLHALCNMKTKADRTRAISRWQKDSMNSDEFESYVSALNQAAASGDEVSDADFEAPFSASRVLSKLSGMVEKSLDAIAELAAVDLPTVMLTFTPKSAEVVEGLKVRLAELSEMAPKLLKQLNERAKVSDSVLEGGIGGLLAAGKNAVVTDPAVEKAAAKPATKKATRSATKSATKPAAEKAAVKPAVSKPATKPAASKPASKPAADKPNGHVAAVKPVKGEVQKRVRPGKGFQSIETASDSVNSTLVNGSGGPAASRRGRGKVASA